MKWFKHLMCITALLFGSLLNAQGHESVERGGPVDTTLYTTGTWNSGVAVPLTTVGTVKKGGMYLVCFTLSVRSPGAGGVFYGIIGYTTDGNRVSKWLGNSVLANTLAHSNSPNCTSAFLDAGTPLQYGINISSPIVETPNVRYAVSAKYIGE